MANHHTQLNTNAKKTQGVADKRAKKQKAGFGMVFCENREQELVLTGFGMGFCITGGVLGIRCNLEGSSFEPPGSLYIYMAVVVIVMCCL